MRRSLTSRCPARAPRTADSHRVRLRYRVAAVAAMLALVAAGCGSDDASESTRDASADTPLDEVDDAPDDDASNVDASDAGEPEATGAVDESEPRFAVPGAAPLELLTPADDAGAWPTLAWKPVDDAATYTVTVYAASGAAYWTWQGAADEVIFGGFNVPPSDGSTIGLRLHEPMSWDVLAYDAAGAIIAQSGERPIAP